MVKNICVTCIFSVCLNHMLANDTAVAIDAGGIIQKQENAVSLLKEKLFISKKYIEVNYDFINHTDKDIQTEVAFPVPRYKYYGEEYPYFNFNDFSVKCNEKPIQYNTQIKAFVNDIDITKMLEQQKLSIPDFAGYKDNFATSQLHSLTENDLTKFQKIGILSFNNESGYYPEWQVELTYHWSQIFPAHKIIHISHKYTPAVGFANLTLKNLEQPTQESTLEPGCPDNQFKKSLSIQLNKLKDEEKILDEHGEEAFHAFWIKYILTTANSWNGPIKDFELVIERNASELMTFCWDWPLEKIGPDTFISRVTNFKPTKELTIYFIDPRFDLSTPQ